MSILHNPRVTVRICQMYYLENLSQKHISAELGISRPQVSRILASARKDNLVNITIKDPFARETAIQEQIRKRYAVREVFVFDTSAYADGVTEFGRMAAQCLNLFISNANTVGVMSGRTVSSTIAAIDASNCRGLHVIPLVGGLGSLNANWHANAIALELARKSCGVSYVLNAPILVQEAKSRDMLVSEVDIANVLQMGAKCDTAIVGIGEISNDSTTALAGGLFPEDIIELQNAGAVATACCSYLDSTGKVLDLPILKRSIGVSLPDIAGSKVIALAVGKNKVEAIHSVLSSGYIYGLMTNMEAARGLLALNE